VRYGGLPLHRMMLSCLDDRLFVCKERWTKGGGGVDLLLDLVQSFLACCKLLQHTSPRLFSPQSRLLYDVFLSAELVAALQEKVQACDFAGEAAGVEPEIGITRPILSRGSAEKGKGRDRGRSRVALSRLCFCISFVSSQLFMIVWNTKSLPVYRETLLVHSNLYVALSFPYIRRVNLFIFVLGLKPPPAFFHSRKCLPQEDSVNHDTR